MKPNLKKLCEYSQDEGRKIDLSDCSYGETSGPCKFIKRPTNYYYFLAGFVRHNSFNRILEIGTHFGGSIRSIAKGIQLKDIENGRMATVDIVDKNPDSFNDYPYIKRFIGDSLNDDIIDSVTKYFDKKVDLLYIDSLHEYTHTMKNIEIYGNALSPEYIILDDIRQCESMERLWTDLVKEFKERAFDASEIAIRPGAGFGVIKWKK